MCVCERERERENHEGKNGFALGWCGEGENWNVRDVSAHLVSLVSVQDRSPMPTSTSA